MQFTETRTQTVAADLPELQKQDVPGPIESVYSQMDIGIAVMKLREGQDLKDQERAEFLQRPWTPERKQDFPFSLCKRAGQKVGKRYLSNVHLSKFKWLAV